MIDDAGVDRPGKCSFLLVKRSRIEARAFERINTTRRTRSFASAILSIRKQLLSFPQRYFADRETLSRVLQSALIAGQGTHTVQEASHGHSSCARSEDPVWTWSRWTSLARASERKRESGRRTASVGALMIKIPQHRPGHLHPWRAPIADFSCVGRDFIKVLREMIVGTLLTLSLRHTRVRYGSGMHTARVRPY